MTRPLDITEAAEALGIGTDQVRDLIASGKLLAFNVSNGRKNCSWRIDLSAIEDFKRARSSRPVERAPRVKRTDSGLKIRQIV